MNPKLLEFFVEKHNKLKKRYLVNQCLSIAMEMKKEIEKYELKGQVFNFTAQSNGNFSPKERPGLLFDNHYAYVCENLVYDPLFSEPIKLDDYLNKSFSEKLRVERRIISRG